MNAYRKSVFILFCLAYSLLMSHGMIPHHHHHDESEMHKHHDSGMHSHHHGNPLDDLSHLFSHVVHADEDNSYFSKRQPTAHFFRTPDTFFIPFTWIPLFDETQDPPLPILSMAAQPVCGSKFCGTAGLRAPPMG